MIGVGAGRVGGRAWRLTILRLGWGADGRGRKAELKEPAAIEVHGAGDGPGARPFALPGLARCRGRAAGAHGVPPTQR